MQPIERSVPIADGTLLEDPHGWIPGRSARFGKASIPKFRKQQ
jgi:hypothetical protein